MMKNIRIILLHTSHAGNIGAAARAMKVMGLSQLYLVNPQCDPFDGQAKAMSVHASDVWQQASVVSSFNEALQDCELVFGTTARQRSFSRPCVNARQAATHIGTVANKTIAVVFGSEKAGLSNAELDRCHYQVTIPTADTYSSLNLAQAVQIMAYELCVVMRQVVDSPVIHQTKLATANELNGLYEHLEQVMRRTGFYKPSHPRRMEMRLRQLLNRARIDQQDLNLLRGILSAVMADHPTNQDG